MLEEVSFETNKSLIKPISFAVLNEVADVMKAVKRINRIEVQGHTDSRGKDAYNRDLSQRRAEAVRRCLISRGVKPARVTAVGCGQEAPIDANASRAGRPSNRRVEFKIRAQQPFDAPLRRSCDAGSRILLTFGRPQL
ncbi:MAG: OOP family OmpA-OmpF porin [Bradymonadia bacterium]|jgi:OOP family OmpA-OmpF porin